uniref:ER membrane protein complex subunit 1 n=1 Tax=Prasinoderma singulare TaxID=676789 RepID=A0A7S3BQ89_9VIRI
MRQLIVVLTSAGKVFGLHSGDGRELWSVYLGTGASGSAALRTVLVWREQVGEADDTELLALGSSGDSTRALWIRASDGEVIAEATLPLAASRALPLEGAAFEGAGGERPVLLASPSGELHLLAVAGGATKDAAAHAEAKEVLAARASKVFFYEADAKAGTVRGFGLVPHADAPAGVRRAQVWQLSLPESEALEAVVERVLDPVHTQVRVLGDRSALYKYLGANTAAVFATATEPERASEGAPPSAVVAGLVVYILDTATGRVLYRTVHMGSAGPVQATFRENWVVYHYWSNEAMRNEMSVLELFDDTRDRPSHVQEGLMQLLGAEVTAPEQSSHSLPPLRVLGQSYYMPMSAKAMGATSTAKGVTARQVLLGTGTDQVLALDRRLLDPRRPLKATPASKEERLPPYAEMLPVDPRRMITHRHTVANLRFIESAPTHLESTCLVLAVGLDRYLTRLAPSRSYDTISESFNYLLLSATVVGMVVATLVAARMSARAELKRKWR